MPKAPCRINASLKAGQRPAFLFDPGGEIEVGDAERLHKQHLSSEWTFIWSMPILKAPDAAFVTFSLDESFRASRDATNALIASCSRGVGLYSG